MNRPRVFSIPPCVIFVLAVCQVGTSFSDALILIPRLGRGDWEKLLNAHIPLVAELNPGFLAKGTPGDLLPRLGGAGYASRILDQDILGNDYALVFARTRAGSTLFRACGDVLWEEDDLALVRIFPGQELPCAASKELRWRRLALEPFRPFHPVPPASRSLEDFVPNRYVQEMVDAFSNDQALADWDGIIQAAQSRYSFNEGCDVAVQYAYDAFVSLGLDTQTLPYAENFPPNIIATIPGRTAPEDVYIVMGHLDDMPGTGPAPGADDNASGAAMVLTLARLMGRYGFASTVRFLIVTGEEQGLLGSRYYAAHAASGGENILGVLDADMIGWEGDGIPVPETLDVAYNDGSEDLAGLMALVASAYGTGCPVDAFYCPSEVYSDHAAFWESGYPAVMGITDDEGMCGHPGYYIFYHTRGDTRERCGDPAFFLGAERVYLAALSHAAVPLCRKPGDGTSGGGERSPGLESLDASNICLAAVGPPSP